MPETGRLANQEAVDAAKAQLIAQAEAMEAQAAAIKAKLDAGQVNFLRAWGQRARMNRLLSNAKKNRRDAAR